MVLESALLHVRPGQEAAFEAAFDEARHLIGFRQSAPYQRWRALLHHFYDPMPEVLHHTPVLEHA
ncbi:hypothetical protein [Ralstonia syzygii]|uniref:Uncharacterized protein n=1 Tax=Ralstonia syzygii R24 TaxID=907261 RepID=G2ZZM0_9RALS|nr:hypothetical protein [Ralstonia syzygii]CCA84330.1 conserved hypothetical protein [Ralstonia syzygii R24]